MTVTPSDIVDTDEVCLAIERACTRWLPSVLATLAPALALPASHVLPDPEAFTDSDDLPSLVVSSPGTSELPVRDGDGTYTTTWEVVVTVYVRGEDHDDTRRATRSYGKAVRVAVLQDGDLDGLALDVLWTGTATEPIARTSERTLQAAAVRFAVTVHDPTPLPLSPLSPPPDGDALVIGWPVTSIEADIDLMPIDHPAL